MWANCPLNGTGISELRTKSFIALDSGQDGRILSGGSIEKHISGALTGVAQWVGRHPTKQKVVNSIPGQVTYAWVAGVVRPCRGT